MKFLYRCFLTAFLVNIFCCSFAQTGYVINGNITTDNSLSAEGATVTLLKYPDSTVVKSTICTQAGRFELDDIKQGSYIILAHKLGYQRFYSPQYQVDADIRINNITLHVATRQLSEVVVTDKRDYIEVHSDKTILNVDKSILASGNSVFDILSTAPGVRIMENQVLLKGGQKALVTINGKAVGQLSDDQLVDLLKSYQSNQVSQIELIENPPARYDAAGGGGVINIILKKYKETGFKASINESASYGQDYKLSNGLNLNYRTNKFNFFGGYTFADNKTPRLLDIDRIIYGTNVDENYNSTTYLKTHSFNGGIDYNLSGRQTIGVLIYGYHNQSGIDKDNTTDIVNNGVRDSTIRTNSHIDRGITNINYNVNYKGTFGKSEQTTLSGDFDYSTYDRGSTELLQNDFFDINNQPYQEPVWYIDNSPSHIRVRSENIDLSQALSKTGTLSLGIKNSYVKSDNLIDFSDSTATQGSFKNVASLTDHFVYRERINAAYGEYSDKFNNTDVLLSLRAEQTKSNSLSLNPDRITNNSYFDLFPNIQLSQDLDKNNTLSIGYDRRISRPNYQDLNPFVAYIDQYSYSTGNVFLQPEYFNTYHITELYKSKYKVTFSYDVTQDFYVPIFQQNDSTKVFTTTTNNIGTRYDYSAEFTLPVDVTKWWKLNLYLYAGYDRVVYKPDSAHKTSTDLAIQLTQDFNITNTLRFEVYGSYETPTFYGIKQYGREWDSRAGLSQSILNNNGTIRLAVSDIFNTNGYHYNSHYLNLDLSGREKLGSRFITATFIYHFGNQSVKNTAKRVGSNTDEQRRLSGSTNDN